MPNRGPTLVEDGDVVEVVVRNEMLHIWKGPVAYALPLSVARKISRRVTAAIAAHDAAPSTVTMACQMCEKRGAH